MIDRKALVRFASEMSAAFSRLADALEAPEAKPVSMQIVGRTPADRLRGERQRAVYGYLEGVGDEGRTTAQVNEGIGYKDFSNTYSTLHRLKQLGIVEQVPGAHPQTWRLAPES